jgi:hypothetical protein
LILINGNFLLDLPPLLVKEFHYKLSSVVLAVRMDACIPGCAEYGFIMMK